MRGRADHQIRSAVGVGNAGRVAPRNGGAELVPGEKRGDNGGR